MEGRARGKGRDGAKNQPPAARRPGNGNGRPAAGGQQVTYIFTFFLEGT